MAVALGVTDVRHERQIVRGSEEGREAAVQFSAAAMTRFLTKTTGEWLDLLDAAGVSAGRVNKVTELLDDPQVLANDLVVEYQHPVAGAVSMVGPLIQMEQTPTSVRRPPPTLGQHNEEVLTELGYSAAEIDKLREVGAVAH